MKVKWSKETPAIAGWYWIKYKGKHGTVSCPAEVIIFKPTAQSKMEANLVRSAFNDSWIEGPNHGGPGLKYHGKLDKTIRFGPKIEKPE